PAGGGGRRSADEGSLPGGPCPGDRAPHRSPAWRVRSCPPAGAWRRRGAACRRAERAGGGQDGQDAPGAAPGHAPGARAMTRRLLAIFDDCGPGDAFAASFAWDALRAANPRAEIVVIAGEHAYEVFRGTKVADRVVRS